MPLNDFPLVRCRWRDRGFAVPDDRLRNAWLARERSVPIGTVLNFAPDGLVLGAGTVLLHAEGPRRLQTLEGQEARVRVFRRR
jgi:hypothetical protein